jgi:RNA polymerase sigma factor (sigma-70 family)
MSFPETRPTLISRLASDTNSADWDQFLKDYWGPIVRFATYVGHLPADQAEDVASETLLLLIKSKLLARWQSSPSGKLRSYLCGITRNLLANRQRVEAGRRRLAAEMMQSGSPPDSNLVADWTESAGGDEDIFYRAWVEDLLSRSMQALLTELYGEGRGDYFRALYGRVCEGLSAADIGKALDATPATVENYLRIAKARLARELQSAVRQHVERYSPAADVDAEFEREWAELGAHLETFGGLEESLRKEAAGHAPILAKAQPSRSFRALQEQVRQGVSD